VKIRIINNKLAKKLEDASAIKKAFGDMAKKVAARLDDIRASPSLAILRQLPQADCHQLKGDRVGEWAVRISGNHRLLFEIDQDPVPLRNDGIVDEVAVTAIVIIGTEDYHKK
jgi:plasmid maintenance system killer protein